jgi:hypothetical protein
VGLAREQRRRLLVKTPGPEPAAGVEGLEPARWDDTYVLELPERPEDLRFGSARNHARIRWATNKAEREGVRVRPAEAESELLAWYSLYAETMRWHAVPPRPYRFFRAMWQVLAPVGMLRLLLAERRAGGRSKLIAGAVVLRCGQTAAYAFNGRQRDELGLRPNDVLQWTAIHELCADGVRSYDLGEVEAHQAGLADFKAKWGAQRRALSRCSHPPGHRRARPPRSEALARRAAERVWKRLPLPLTTQLGGWLYGHL